MAAATGRGLFPLWAILAVAGARLGKILGLRWTDVDLHRRLLTVAQATTGRWGR